MPGQSGLDRGSAIYGGYYSITGVGRERERKHARELSITGSLIRLRAKQTKRIDAPAGYRDQVLHRVRHT